MSPTHHYQSRHRGGSDFGYARKSPLLPDRERSPQSSPSVGVSSQAKSTPSPRAIEKPKILQEIEEVIKKEGPIIKNPWIRSLMAKQMETQKESKLFEEWHDREVRAWIMGRRKDQPTKAEFRPKSEAEYRLQVERWARGERSTPPDPLDQSFGELRLVGNKVKGRRRREASAPWLLAEPLERKELRRKGSAEKD